MNPNTDTATLGCCWAHADPAGADPAAGQCGRPPIGAAGGLCALHHPAGQDPT